MTLLNEADQARHFVDQVLENRERGMRLMSQAVLFRTSSHSGQIEVDLTRRNVPFVKFGGLKFLDSAHVRDLLAVLRFAQNPRDRVAGFRVLQLVPMAAGKVLDALAAHTHRIEALAPLPPPPPARHAQPVHPACDAGKLRGDPLVAAYSGRWQTQTRRPAKHRHCGQNAWHVDLTARSSSLCRTADAWSFN